MSAPPTPRSHEHLMMNAVGECTGSVIFYNNSRIDPHCSLLNLFCVHDVPCVCCAIYIYIAAWWLCTEYLFYYIAGCLLQWYRKRLWCGGRSNVKGMILQLFPPPDSFPFTHFFPLYITSLSLSDSLSLARSILQGFMFVELGQTENA